MKRLIGAVVVIALIAAAAWWWWKPSNDGRIPVYGVAIAATYPHDQTAFTEGLFFQDGSLYESTGEIGESGFRQSDVATGRVIKSYALPAPYFGEGIVPWKDRLYQLTWKDQKGFIYGLKDFAPVGDFSYTGEGWGATHNDRAIIMSDGTSTLRFLDPETLQTLSALKVTAGGCPVAKLNELEWVDGQIYANIWQTSLIARIDPKTGAVTSFLDISALGPKDRGPDDVANGIAYDAGRKRLFVTGKRWPQLYQVRANETRTTSDAANALSACGAKS
jgi:glutaminyl-peptide cyclotransferase